MTLPLEQTHTHAEIIQALNHLAAAEELLKAASFDPSVDATPEEIAIMREARSARLSTLDTLRKLAALCHQPSVPGDLRKAYAPRNPNEPLIDLTPPAPESELLAHLSKDSR